ncbi:MAG: hypothetical protein DRJ66_02405 [Thermoprotei archaeon]|nr:MAG: hypothetical protein DRJ66_02405 [Thermoprotei archaeon]RLF18069.1 MAG: hypothetical protein DRZ82_08940 [Thermoprotei archaeon]
MGRRTIASIILDSIRERREIMECDDVYLVVYDFSVSSSKHIPPTFYRNLLRIQRALNDGIQVQKSVIECSKLETALAIADLARHYGANVRIYRASQVIS